MFRLISMLACSSAERHSEGGRLAAESQSAPCHVSVGVTLECGCVGEWDTLHEGPGKIDHASQHAQTTRTRATSTVHASCPQARRALRLARSERLLHEPLHLHFGFSWRCRGGYKLYIKVRPCRIRYRTPLPQVNGQAPPHRKQNRTDAQSTGVHRLTRRARAPPSL